MHELYLVDNIKLKSYVIHMEINKTLILIGTDKIQKMMEIIIDNI